MPGPPRGLDPACGRCGAALRSPLLAALLSMTLPGLGHLYLHRRLLGSGELVVGFALFVAALARLCVVFLRVLDGAAVPLDLLRACIPWAFVLATYSLLDGLFTWMVSKRRLVLRGTSSKPS